MGNPTTNKADVVSYSVISYNSCGRSDYGWNVKSELRARRLVVRLLATLVDTGYLVCDHGNGVFTAIHTRSRLKRTIRLNRNLRPQDEGKE